MGSEVRGTRVVGGSKVVKSNDTVLFGTQGDSKFKSVDQVRLTQTRPLLNCMHFNLQGSLCTFCCDVIMFDSIKRQEGSQNIDDETRWSPRF